MTAPAFTIDHIAVRRAVLDEVRHENRHAQGTWLAEDLDELIGAGLVTEDELPTEVGQVKTLCGTSGCVAGHAFLTQMDRVQVAMVPTTEKERMEWYGEDVKSIRRMQYIVDGIAYTNYERAARAVTQKLGKAGADLPFDADENIADDRFERTPAWIETGQLLLGLTHAEAVVLFKGDWDHEQILYSLERLVEGEPILTTVPLRELRTNPIYRQAFGHGMYISADDALDAFDGPYDDHPMQTLIPVPDEYVDALAAEAEL